MDITWTQLCIFLLLCTDLSCVAQQSTISQLPKPATKGSSNRHTIRCGYQLPEGKTFVTLKLFLSNTDAENSIAFIAGANPGWAGGNVATTFQQRGNLTGSKAEGHLSLVLKDTLCEDKGRNYTCDLEYTDTGNVLRHQTSWMAVEIEAAPLVPEEMTRSPSSENVTEFSSMTFECKGNVGLPAGTFHWYKFVGSGTGENVTAQAQQLTVTPEDCTFRRTSRLTLNLTRTEVNQRLVVRCRVSQKLVTTDLSSCSDPGTDFCRTSPEISVQYPVSVSVTKDMTSAVEGTNTSIVCNTQGNPLPHLVEWRKEGENETWTGNTLTLSQLTLNDSGRYICTAYNTIGGVVLNASDAIDFTVDKTTTPPPVTTPVTTLPEETTKEGDEINKAGAGGDDTTIIIVVVVVVAVVIIVAVIVVILIIRRRRKGKGVEEPPEKPFNNHAGINTVATRPDLVSNDYNNPPTLKTEDGLAYAELQFDNKPRSRRPLAFDDSHANYSDVSMPQV